MWYALLFFGELFVLFLLSRSLSRAISFLLYRLTRSKKIAIHGLAILFFPGTVLHEISHALMAGILGVHVGQMEFIPKIEGDKVKLGSVQIAKTDFIRRFLIGAAPFFNGTILILGLLYFASYNHLFDNYFILFGLGYVVFEIGNTMFSSRKDMEGAIELLLTLIFIITLLYVLGIRLPAVNPDLFFGIPAVAGIFEKGSLFLFMPIALDCLLIGLLKLSR